MEEFESALKDLNTCIKINPGVGDAFYNRAFVFMAMDEPLMSGYEQEQETLTSTLNTHVVAKANVQSTVGQYHHCNRSQYGCYFRSA